MNYNNVNENQFFYLVPRSFKLKGRNNCIIHASAKRYHLAILA